MYPLPTVLALLYCWQGRVPAALCTFKSDAGAGAGLDTRQKTVTDALRAMIMRRDVGPGEHLLEVALARRLGASRTPVRAALTALAQEGLLVHRPQRGYFVRAFTLKDVLDAYRVRAHLEGLACRIAAEAGLDEGARATLEACLADGDAILRHGALRDEDNEPWRAMNDRFHQAILAATGNASLIDATQRTLALPFLSARVVHWHDHAALATSHFLHHAMYRAMARREGGRAEALMREHIWAAAEIIESRYDAVAGNAAPQGVEGDAADA